MTITAQRLLTELGHRAWSGFNIDDMVWGNEDSMQAVTELNFAVRYLINLKDFPFKAKEQKLNIKSNTAMYSMPEGQITNIYDANTLDSLVFVGDGSKYDKESKGKPNKYWVEYNNPDGARLRVYPIPDNNYNYKIVYNQYKPVIDAEGETQFEFQNADDIINMPENLEHLFMDCLVLRVMVTNNKDDQDENYQPTIKEFNEAWNVFIRACKPAKVDNYTIF